MAANGMSRVSLIIPAYNSAELIASALKSALTQTRPPDEIIVVDDGSTDNTAEVARAVGDAVTVIRQDNAGVAAARNAGILASTGDWIALLDSDDTWLPRRLEAALELHARYPDLRWSAGGFLERGLDGVERSRLLSPRGRQLLHDGVFANLFEVFHRDCLFTTIMVLMQRTLLDEVGLFDQSLQRREDVDLWTRIALRNPRVGWIDEPLAVYQRRSNSLTHGTEPHTMIEVLRMLRSRGMENPENLHLLDPYGRWLMGQACKGWLHRGSQEDLRLALREMPDWIPSAALPVLQSAASLPESLFPALQSLFRLRLRMMGRG